MVRFQKHLCLSFTASSYSTEKTQKTVYYCSSLLEYKSSRNLSLETHTLQIGTKTFFPQVKIHIKKENRKMMIMQDYATKQNIQRQRQTDQKINAQITEPRMSKYFLGPLKNKVAYM